MQFLGSTGRAGIHEAADFTSIFIQKIQNKQTQNDYQKAFLSCTRESIKNVFSGWLMGVGVGGKPSKPSRNRRRLSSKHSKMDCYQQIINSSQRSWGHFNKPIQAGLLQLGIMISGSSVLYMNNGDYIDQGQSLLEPFNVCWYPRHFSLIRVYHVVWCLYFHHYKKKKKKSHNKTSNWALQIRVTEKMSNSTKSENIWMWHKTA